MDNTGDNIEQDDLIMADPPNIRENLISTAVNFLQNPRIQDSPLTQKKLFLEKKGLTKAEVEIAVSRAGVLDPQNNTGQNNNQIVAISPTGYAPSTWSRVRDVTALVIVVGGVGTALYRFYYHVIRPYWFGLARKTVEQQILEMQEKMVESLARVQESLEKIQQSLASQEEKLSTVSLETGARKTEQNLARIQDSQFVSELKSEVSSIKGLLLNRRQFPPTPNSSPVLPAWQRSKAPSLQDKQVENDEQILTESSASVKDEVPIVDEGNGEPLEREATSMEQETKPSITVPQCCESGPNNEDLSLKETNNESERELGSEDVPKNDAVSVGDFPDESTEQ